MQSLFYEIVSNNNVKRVSKLTELSSTHANLFQIMERVNEYEIVSDDNILRIVHEDSKFYEYNRNNDDV